MENGVEIVGAEHRPSGEMELAAEDGTLKDGDVGEAKDSDENEVFEEAVDNNIDSFYKPHDHEASDSQKMAFGGEENEEAFEGENGELRLVHEAEKFHEPTEEKVDDRIPVEQEEVASEKFDESMDAQVDDPSPDEQELVVSESQKPLAEPFDDRLSAESPEEERKTVGSEEKIEAHDESDHPQSPAEEHGAVGSDKRIEANDESDHALSIKEQKAVPEEKIEAFDESDHALEEDGKGDVPIKLNGMEADTLVEEVSFVPMDDGERIPENGNELVGVKPVSGENHGAISDEAHVTSQERIANGDFLEASFNEADVNDVRVVQQMLDVSVNLGTLSDGQARILQSENIQFSQDIAEIDRGIEADSHVTGATEEPQKQGEEERPSSGSKSIFREEFEKETVLVEGLGESSSTDDDNNRTISQPAPSSISDPEISGGPALPSRPAGLGSSAPLLEPATRSLQQPRANGAVPQRQSQPSEDPANDDAEENDETRKKLQMIRVKFLRLAHRLGQTPHNVVVAQVLYRLGLAEQLRRNTNQPGVFSYDRASVMAEQLEASGQEPLDFSCTIMVIGKTGVGKSATINSIFDEVKFHTDAFQSATKKVQDIVGMVQGIQVRVIDTPGLLSSSSDQQRNEKILHSVKRFINRTPPDIVLYFDRLDMQSRDYGDLPLLRTITNIFGTSIWFNAIVVLTHAASAPPEGPNGSPLSYEMFVTQRSHVVQQAIRQTAVDVRLMNPVSLVENHSACRMNRAGQRVLPNGQVWKPQLLLLSFASKILAEANMLLKLHDSPPGQPFGSRARVPPLPFLLSSLLQSRPQLKLPEEQFGNEDAVDEDLDEACDSDDGFDYDELPPFKCLNKSQLAKLSKAQKKAYFEELDYREKLFYKKQLKEEKKRRKDLKKMAEAVKDLPNNFNSQNVEDESSGPAVPVLMPDLVLPPTFDSENSSHRYRSLDSSNQWLVRPVLETQGWDHDVGYEGLNVERLFVVKDKIPLSLSGQLTKDKKDCTFQMEVASSVKHSEGNSTSLGLDMLTVGKDIAYTLRGETRFNNFRRNNTAAGVSATILGDALSAGVKIEDKLIVNKRFRLLMSGGAMMGRGDVAYGGRLEATLRDKDFPIGRTLSTLALSVVDWHGDLSVGCNVQSQFPLGRGTNVIGHANLSNRGTGQVGIRLNSSDQLQIALFALVPIFRTITRILFDSSQPI